MDWITIDAAATVRSGPQKVCIPFFELIWQDSPNRNDTPVVDSATARNTTGTDQPAACALRKKRRPGMTCQQI